MLRKLFVSLLLLLIITIFSGLVSGCRVNERIASEPIESSSQIPLNNDIPIVFTTETYDIEMISGIVYGKGLVRKSWDSNLSTTKELLLDLYEPLGAPGNRPAIIFIHGGGFIGGNRKQGALSDMAKYFAERGWVTVSIDYRLIGDYGTIPDEWFEVASKLLPVNREDQQFAIYPAARDAKSAVRWLYANADKYGINTEYITVAGGSAGAYTAIGIGVTDPEDYTNELSVSEDPTLEFCNLDQPSKVSAIVDFWGGPGLANAIENLYSKDSFDESDPPLIIFHGTNDRTVDISEAKKLRDLYDKNKSYYELYELEGAGHSAWSETINGKSLSEVTFEFLTEQLGLTVE